MSAEPIYCPAETYPQTRETPRELCENEVENEGDLCPTHEADDGADDDFDYDRYIDEKAERAADENYYTDYGD